MKKLIGSLDPELNIGKISQDSRDIQSGDLFICIDGTQVDGHNYVETAVANGAGVIVAHKDIQKAAANVPVVYVPDTGKAMSLLANHFYGYPSESMKVIGVTGTNGKTTVTYLVEAILKAMDKKTGLMGNRAGNGILHSGTVLDRFGNGQSMGAGPGCRRHDQPDA